MSNNNPLPVVPDDQNRSSDEGVDATRQVDGDEVLDRDANDDLIDSADADALAAQEGEE